jgi:hypothetical protein
MGVYCRVAVPGTIRTGTAIVASTTA